MKRVEISVEVTLRAALLARQEEWGVVTLAPTHEQMKSMTDEELELLDRFAVVEPPAEQKSLRIRTAPASWDAVLETIQFMLLQQGVAKAKAEREAEATRDREKYVPDAAEVLRAMATQPVGVSDVEFIDVAIEALMEDVRDRLVSNGIATNLIRILNCDTQEWKLTTIKVRGEYTLEAAGILRKVQEAMKDILPRVRNDLFFVETSVARVSRKSRDQGIEHRPVTHIFGVMHCAASSSMAILVRAEPLSPVVNA